MRSFHPSCLKLAAYILAGAVVVQILCPASLFAIAATVVPSTRHSGCHESQPANSPLPAPVQKCCAGGPAPQACPPARYVPQAPVASTGFVADRAMPAASVESSQFKPERAAAPPGFTVLRV